MPILFLSPHAVVFFLSLLACVSQSWRKAGGPCQEVGLARASSNPSFSLFFLQAKYPLLWSGLSAGDVVSLTRIKSSNVQLVTFALTQPWCSLCHFYQPVRIEKKKEEWKMPLFFWSFFYSFIRFLHHSIHLISNRLFQAVRDMSWSGVFAVCPAEQC